MDGWLGLYSDLVENLTFALFCSIFTCFFQNLPQFRFASILPSNKKLSYPSQEKKASPHDDEVTALFQLMDGKMFLERQLPTFPN